MGLLYASELADSREWVRQNAQDILDSVKKAGGWAKVFPKKVPDWLHKLRNYFNVEPRELKLVDKSVTDHWMREIRKHGELDTPFIGKRTLSGHVYFDEEIEVWYQMGAGGTIYHWGDDVKVAWAEAAYTSEIRKQTGTPVFKLICPDGTGGSKETIIHNWYGQAKIGSTNNPQLVVGKVVPTMKHQGSYNFAETSVVGLDEHKKYDVKTHENDPNYIDPPNRFEELKKRIFHEHVIKSAGGETQQRPKATYADDIREDPLKRK